MSEQTVKIKEKKSVALTSVVASVFLTSGKLIVGILTGSLGILSEAAHSALDLGAALITYFAVGISEKPADLTHNYGHHKVESLSALAETFLLVITCIWIIKEAINRLFFQTVIMDITYWSYGILILSIIIDYSRARALTKTAKKYHSQALEADAIHFSSDVLSSLVVLLGLILTQYKIEFADSLAALMVAIFVLRCSYQLTKKAIDALLDRSPDDLRATVIEEIGKTPGVVDCHKLRLRKSGPTTQGDVHVVMSSNISFDQGHLIANDIEARLAKNNIELVIHFEPISEQKTLQV